MNPTTTSSTASHQHQQEQEMLANFAVPNPPLSTQQSQYLEEDTRDPNSSTNSVQDETAGPRTLWMGDLDPWLDEPAIVGLWWQILNKKVQVKIIRPKFSKPDMNLNGLSHSGYCFIEFETFTDAKQALGLNGQLLPDLAMPSQRQFPNNPDNQKKYFRLNWASGATLSAPIIQSPEYSLFVGDLSASTTEAHLLAFFQKLFPTSVKTVRVMTDPVSGKSRCFGFVRFTDENERQRALVEMNGVWFGGRPLRVALATPRNQNNYQFNQFPNNQMNQYQGSPGQFPPPGQFGNSFPSSPSQFANNPNLRRNNGYYNESPEMMYPNGYGYYPPMVPMLPDEGIPPSENPEGSVLLESDPNSSGSGKGGQPPNITPNETGNSEEQNTNMNSPMTATPNHPLHGQPFNDPNNTTVFVGGLSSEVSEQTLFTLFKSFGIIQQIKIPPGKNCGFVKYSTREEAEDAIAAMQGYIIGGNRVRLSWGRVSMNNKKFQQQQHQVAQVAQIQAAAALSMGLDHASAIAAAAAAAAGGYPPGMPPQGMPQGMPNMPQGLANMPQGMPPPGMPPALAPVGMPPNMQGMPPNMPMTPPGMAMMGNMYVPVPEGTPDVGPEEAEESEADTGEAGTNDKPEEPPSKEDNELTNAMKSMKLEK